ncbi:diguanylate cyclase [Oscillatoria sp. CS-180]|uniref:diguanylate cyclase domain-containing protein n=1 Tax=Oscillatoria sp. CS-180 TaxID=3021720 RepID=UPI00232DEB1E|nr:diguanylate cyclase [Oscillatoria sp. CS-180]MDB9524419.1 diguanylate cyclase [Oscillatoria sp. CS-180]
MVQGFPTVLVVDDDNDSRSFLNIALQAGAFQVLEAATGMGGLSIVMNEVVDIVLLDAVLPDIDGFRCCEIMHQRLRDRCPPVLMITALSDEISVEKAFEAQATDFITKPVHLSVLLHRIKRVLQERQLLRELELANSYLQHISSTDELTGLSNRRFFQANLNKEWKRLVREQTPLGVLLCDLDYFKQYNDAYGHLEGDRCLKQFAAILRSSVERSTDLVARYGGEEFILLLPNTSLEGLKVIDQRIRAQLTRQAIPHYQSPISQIVTYSSGGTAVIPQISRDPTDLIEEADKALYEAKDLGRNRLIIRNSMSLV